MCEILRGVAYGSCEECMPQMVKAREILARIDENFTKGKWFLGSYETKAGKHRKIEVVAGVKVSEGAIKRIACISGTDAESRANAWLIASAPELYEAVCDLLDYAYEALHRAGGENEIRGKAPRILREICEYQSLIDRVKGGDE